MKTLQEYIEEAASAPWEWGAMDCVMFAAGWVLNARGIDIASTIRGKYNSMRGAQRLISRNGGFVSGVGAHVDTLMDRTTSPVDGDIGIVDAPITMRGHMPVCGAVMSVMHGGLWVCKSSTGMVASTLPVVAAWRV